MGGKKINYGKASQCFICLLVPYKLLSNCRWNITVVNLVAPAAPDWGGCSFSGDVFLTSAFTTDSYFPPKQGSSQCLVPHITHRLVLLYLAQQGSFQPCTQGSRAHPKRPQNIPAPTHSWAQGDYSLSKFQFRREFLLLLHPGSFPAWLLLSHQGEQLQTQHIHHELGVQTALSCSVHVVPASLVSAH